MLFILGVSFSCVNRSQDNSLTVEQYMKLGMPDPRTKWDMEDYTQANNVLAKIKWQRPLELPAKDSEKSGLLFDHMVSLEYLSFLQDSTLSLNAKAERISDFTRVYDHWMDIYTIPILSQNPYQREMLELRIFNLRMMEAMVNLMHEINESDDPADVGLQYGHKFIIENYLTSLHTDLKAQRSTPDFLEPDQERLTDSIYASVMRNKEWMDSLTLSELTQSLHAVIDSTSSNYIRNKYTDLEKLLVDTQTAQNKLPQ